MRTDDSGTKSGDRVRSFRGYLYVNVVRVGEEGGRRERTTLPWPGLAMEDSKGDFRGMLYSSLLLGDYLHMVSEEMRLPIDRSSKVKTNFNSAA